MFIRSAFNYDTVEASNEAGLFCPEEESKTQQQFKDECDINTIVKRFGITGELPSDLAVPQSGDFTGITDFQSAMNVVRMAEEAFAELPADLRARFNHDPGRFVEFFNDPGNKDEARKLGLLAPVPEVTRDVVQAVDELKEVLTPKA